MTGNPLHSDDLTLLRQMFDSAVAVADPMRSLVGWLPERPKGRLVVIGAGKASARMGEAVEAAWGPCEGLIITRYGYARPLKGITVAQAAHPVPDQAGQDATAQMLDLLRSLGEGDHVLALISGGASALLIQPAGAITLTEKQQINADLLASGARIGQMNVIRKHLSRVKGGQLAAAAYPAQMTALMISDVPGDDPAMIGSGPTVGDDSTPQDARDILDAYKITLPHSAETVLAQGSSVVATADERLSRVTNIVCAAPSQSLTAAADIAAKAGLDTTSLGDAIEGEAREVAQAHAALALKHQARMPPDAPPLVLLSGGELTVTRTGAGVGGPNAEYALALAIALNGAPGISAIACDTDGVDGAAEVAGAVIHPKTLQKARDAGIDPKTSLANNDAHSFFEAIKDQVITGPTLTNVNDFRAILIRPKTPGATG